MSWLCVNVGYPVAKEREAYSDHGEKNAGGTKYSRGHWCDVKYILSEIEATNGNVEQGENIVCHGRMRDGCGETWRDGGCE